MSGRKSELPPIRDIARDLRDGATLDTLCHRYNVEPRTLANRLAYAGYGTDGHPKHAEARPGESLAGAVGNCVTGNGGGDYTGLPLTPILHTRRRREFLGLDWSTSPVSGPTWREV